MRIQCTFSALFSHSRQHADATAGGVCSQLAAEREHDSATQQYVTQHGALPKTDSGDALAFYDHARNVVAASATSALLPVSAVSATTASAGSRPQVESSELISLPLLAISPSKAWAFLIFQGLSSVAPPATPQSVRYCLSLTLHCLLDPPLPCHCLSLILHCMFAAVP